MDHYWMNNNLKSEVKQISIQVNDINLSFFTDNGVFSKKGLDFGTRSLLINLPELKGKVLDFGCGYGPIGIYISKKYDINVDMVDINNRSIELAKKNAILNKVKTNVFVSDVYTSINDKYDYIVTNPPIRVGKDTLYKILFEAKEHLNKDGELWLVVNKNQGAKSLVKDLSNSYKVEIKDKNKGFYIICCLNR